MIKISKQVDYAFQLIAELAKLEKSASLSLKKFSLQSNISFLFLQKIAKSLREAGIINSIKGKNGGYMLVKPIETLNVKEVIEAVEGTYNAVDCAGSSKCCQKNKECSMKSGFKMITNQINEYFEKLKVTDIL